MNYDPGERVCLPGSAGAYKQVQTNSKMNGHGSSPFIFCLFEETLQAQSAKSENGLSKPTADAKYLPILSK